MFPIGQEENFFDPEVEQGDDNIVQTGSSSHEASESPVRQKKDP